MRKLIALLMVAGMFTIVSCGPSAEEKAKMEEAKVDSPAVETPAADQTAAAPAADSTAAPVVDSAKADAPH